MHRDINTLDNEKIEMPNSKFDINAQLLLDGIRNSSGRSFEIPTIEAFLREIRCKTLKSPASDKRDITIKVHDLNTNMTPTLGFSIKSLLGGASTLFNAGKNTNFIYMLTGYEKDQQILMNEINNIEGRSRIRDRIIRLIDNEVNLQLVGIEGTGFHANLQLLDSDMPEILARMILYYYSEGISDIDCLVDKLNCKNPCDYNMSFNHPYYKYKIKNMLTDMALGMTASKVWTGKYDATGGYIIVKESGEIVCYHIYNRTQFQDYLLNHTYFDTSSSSRHDFGYIYENDGSLNIKLNFQIRFKE